ncbi:MAG: threonine synthase [Parcubacteria bacterium C7867-001]|nr:MAG: threonine synthase [Parcubacteria bacterium C7867-001]
MRYVSTRGIAPHASFREVLMTGLAPDGGLYVPETYPELTERMLDMLRGRSYADVASVVLSLFMDDIPRHTLERIIDETYCADVFGTDAVTPVQKLHNHLYLLKLSEGPTLAFKDIALQLVARLMEYELEEQGGCVNILASTSGDTGSAAEEAFASRKRVNLFVLSPKGRMSPFQKAQMYTHNEANIFNIVIDGSFDVCQSLMKKVNADAKFKKEVSLGAVNSTNWARIAAQVVYYVYAYLQVPFGREGVSFVIPSGNFGNAFACHVAREMGVPIETIVVATNENDVLDEFFKSGSYRPRSEVAVTSSPSMDIAEASNLERLIYDFPQRGPERVTRFLEQLTAHKEARVSMLRAKLYGWESGWVSDRSVLETIRTMDARFGVMVDPHTAVACLVALEQPESATKLIVAETAKPAKFADTIREALGKDPDIPDRLTDLMQQRWFVHELPADAEAIKSFIRSKVAVTA